MIMKSKIIDNLYFAGEIVSIAGRTEDLICRLVEALDIWQEKPRQIWYY